jgi:enamine deaminase RidA (YjgF/YER057c/UK114 family)
MRQDGTPIRIELPVATFGPYSRDGNTLYISGQLPFQSDGTLASGKLGENVSVEEGSEIARLCGRNILGQIEAALSSFDAVDQIIRLTVYVASAPGFNNQTQVANGASDLMVEVFGERGRHARSAIGVAELPRGVPVEVEAIVRVRS